MSFNIEKEQPCSSAQKRSFVRKSSALEQKSPAFKGAITTQIANGTVQVLQTSPVLAPILVDLGSMVLPRTYVDWTRNMAAGIESFRREVSSTVNLFMSGLYAVGAGFLINRFTGNKNPNLHMNGDTVDVLKNAWQTSNANKNNPKLYYEKILNKTSGAFGEGSSQFSEKAVKTISDRLEKLHGEEFSSNTKNPFKRFTLWRKRNKELDDITKYAIKELKSDKGVSVSLGGKTIECNMKKLIRNIHESDKNLFRKYSPEILDSVASRIKKLNKTKSVVGLGVALGIAFSLQSINRYLTSLKTGTTDFVGLPGYEENAKNNKNKEEGKKGLNGKLLLAKAASVAAMTYLTATTIVGGFKPNKVSKLFTKPLKYLEGNGKLPTMNQVKSLFGATVLGRMCSSSDGNELRETNIRDTAGFLNWLVLGEFVTGLTAYKLAERKGLVDKMFNGPKVPKDANFWKKSLHVITKMSAKVHTELDAMGLDKKTKQAAKSISNKSTMTGLIYSGVAIGLIAPWFNKYLTNKMVGKKPKKVDNPQPTQERPGKDNYEYNKMIVDATLGDNINNQPQKPVLANDQSKQGKSEEFIHNKELVEQVLGN